MKKSEYNTLVKAIEILRNNVKDDMCEHIRFSAGIHKDFVADKLETFVMGVDAYNYAKNKK